MLEIQIPDKLEQDCGNCQGMCCMAMSHRVVDRFPIEQDKPVGVPCRNLKIDTSNQDELYKCGVYNERDFNGWHVCKFFNCFGAGQAISSFFKDLGINWAMELEKPDEEQDKLMLENLNNAYFLLYKVFQYLFNLKASIHFASNDMYEAARIEAQLIAADLSEHIKSGQEVKIFEWYGQRFMPAMSQAAEEARNNYFSNKVSRVLSIFK